MQKDLIQNPVKNQHQIINAQPKRRKFKKSILPMKYNKETKTHQITRKIPMKNTTSVKFKQKMAQIKAYPKVHII